MFGENIALELKNTRVMSVVSETISDLYMIPGEVQSDSGIPGFRPGGRDCELSRNYIDRLDL